MKLAEMTGQLNVDAVADSLTRDQLLEWWAYGYLQGWFPEPEQQKGLDPQAAMEHFQRLGHG